LYHILLRIGRGGKGMILPQIVAYLFDHYIKSKLGEKVWLEVKRRRRLPQIISPMGEGFAGLAFSLLVDAAVDMTRSEPSLLMLEAGRASLGQICDIYGPGMLGLDLEGFLKKILIDSWKLRVSVARRGVSRLVINCRNKGVCRFICGLVEAAANDLRLKAEKIYETKCMFQRKDRCEIVCILGVSDLPSPKFR
jgi:hypothetical protein